MRAIIANSSIQLTPEMVSELVVVVASADVIGVRAPSDPDVSASTKVEETVLTLAQTLNKGWCRYRPDSAIAPKERTYARDYRLVAEADELFAYFSEGKVMEGGTGHVVKAALEVGTKVTAYEVTSGGINVVGMSEYEDRSSP